MSFDPDKVRLLLAAGNVILGPMAGVTDAPFRVLCKRMGAGLTFTEMISAKSLHFSPDARKVSELLALSSEETPCVVQLFGAEPEVMAEQARRIVDAQGDDIAFIDINMGCPVAKVVSRGEGSAMMRTPELAARVVDAVASAVPVPVSVKIRKGWDEQSADAVGFARTMEAAGASAVTVHGRTRGQFYRGAADWQAIAEVKAALAVPVIGSGDVLSAEGARSMLERTGVDAVMVARGAQGYPWIFREARALIDLGESLPGPGDQERVAVAREHLRALVERLGEEGARRMRKHVSWYITGMPSASVVRDRAYAAAGSRELDALLADYADYLREREARRTA